jgi:hypothetical protein
VLAVGEPGKTDLVAFRDGSKLGFGQATREIHDTVLGAARLAGAAQYRVPPGYRTIDVFSAQATFAVPEAWEFDSGQAKIGPRRAWGRIVFAPGEAEGALAGPAPSIFVSLHDATKGMSCEGLSPEAERAVLDLAGAELREAGIAPGRVRARDRDPRRGERVDARPARGVPAPGRGRPSLARGAGHGAHDTEVPGRAVGARAR